MSRTLHRTQKQNPVSNVISGQPNQNPKQKAHGVSFDVSTSTLRWPRQCSWVSQSFTKGRLVHSSEKSTNQWLSFQNTICTTCRSQYNHHVSLPCLMMITFHLRKPRSMQRNHTGQNIAHLVALNLMASTSMDNENENQVSVFLTPLFFFFLHLASTTQTAGREFGKVLWLNLYTHFYCTFTHARTHARMHNTHTLARTHVHHAHTACSLSGCGRKADQALVPVRDGFEYSVSKVSAKT